MTLQECLAQLGAEQRRQLQIAFEAQTCCVIWLNGNFIGVHVPDDFEIVTEARGSWSYGRREDASV